jgi:hypothetical protein
VDLFGPPGLVHQLPQKGKKLGAAAAEIRYRQGGPSKKMSTILRDLWKSKASNTLCEKLRLQFSLENAQYKQQ